MPTTTQKPGQTGSKPASSAAMKPAGSKPAVSAKPSSPSKGSRPSK